MASVAAGQGIFFSLHQQISSQNPDKPSKPPTSKRHLLSLKNVAISAAAGFLIRAAYKNRSIIGIGSGGGGGGAGGVAGGGGGRGGGGGGGGWKKPLFPDFRREWDAHGLPPNTAVTLNELCGFKVYKVSEIAFFVLDDGVLVGELPYSEIISLRAGGVYTKALLQKELAKLACMTEKIDLEVKTNPDGTIGLTVFRIMESTSPDEKNERGSIVKIKLKELENKSAECSIDPGRLILPGGTVSFEHRKIKGLNTSFLGTITSSNLLNPQDDLVFSLEWLLSPNYLHGLSNYRNSTVSTSCFNSRKLSPVFTGPGVGPIWVDRAGIKIKITENFTPQMKFTHGIGMEEIITRDRNSHISSTMQRVLPDGRIIAGAPTTASGTGIDRMVFAQVNITSDNTKLVNGQIVGNRNVLQMDVRRNIGSWSQFFDRHYTKMTRLLITMTSFIQLKEVEKGAGKAPPPVLVLNGCFGKCMGNIPMYNAFTLGGPYSVRGYDMGEIGAASC